ncbi:MAG: molybdopterin-synthase adenylyltransferase MoeB [Nitrospirae bacterium]|jgi:molybdopterin/thiamine biosynthesis adenylyltransferase|nr:molybdopterin-synthase adenylyltransferase MoeB [Nitrospirota bacterium]
MKFTQEQHLRYLRHIMLPEVGEEGQAKIAKAKVFIVGAGGLGSPAGYYLTAAGVGTIAIIDNDNVDLSNLQRQIAHSVKTLGKPKVESAKNTFESLNPDVNIIAIKERLTKNNILDLIGDYDAVVDCSDNFATRFLVNDACIMKKRPLITGAIFQFEGQLTAVIPGEGPCYRCLFEEPPPPDALPAPSEAGLLGIIPGVIGTLQASEVLKLIIGIGSILKGELLIYNALKSSFRKVKVPKNPHCPVCSENPTITELIDYS